MSYLELHNFNIKATPIEMCRYKQSLMLNKLIQMEIPKGDWLDPNFQQTFSGRTGTLIASKQITSK